MKKTREQIIGWLLLLGVLLVAAGFHWLGPGLITTVRPAPQPAATAQGVVITQMTTYHIALTPLVVFGITGLLLALIPQWSVTRSRRDRWPMFGVLSILLAMSGLLFGYLAAYTPDGVAVLGAIIALSSCALGLVLGLAALACRERHRWLSLLGIVLSIVGSLRYFTPA